ncbi:hypothetical protein J3F84DRAFT_104223 [Trichoderma pleuroticola]
MSIHTCVSVHDDNTCVFVHAYSLTYIPHRPYVGSRANHASKQSKAAQPEKSTAHPPIRSLPLITGQRKKRAFIFPIQTIYNQDCQVPIPQVTCNRRHHVTCPQYTNLLKKSPHIPTSYSYVSNLPMLSLACYHRQTPRYGTIRYRFPHANATANAMLLYSTKETPMQQSSHEPQNRSRVIPTRNPHPHVNVASRTSQSSQALRKEDCMD